MSGYDWDPGKARANARKHGVTFEEADDVLNGWLAREIPDERHSVGERRIRTYGYTPQGLLIVVITSEGGRRPRIISARRATKRERDEYVDR